MKHKFKIVNKNYMECIACERCGIYMLEYYGEGILYIVRFKIKFFLGIYFKTCEGMVMEDILI